LRCGGFSDKLGFFPDVRGCEAMFRPVCLAFAWLVSAPLAQAQAGDPFRGAFVAVESALPPAEALRQAELLVRSLSGLAPQRPGVTDTYILSVSLWNDPVFENEAKEAAAILARHFDAADRTIVLSAGKGSGERTYPAAIPNNIQAALAKIGGLMDPDEDLAVVFLTSHGGADGAIALQEANRLGGALRAQHLRNSLNQSGVGNRVVIVSACYSGHFILPFSDPNTIVLTAAAADKTSFGCEPTREWTYFGDAFFNRTLRAGLSLVEAYDASLGLIEDWEEDLIRSWDALPAARRPERRPELSNPQKHVGEAAAGLLARAEGYGASIACAGGLSIAIDRARAAKPLKGLSDLAALQASRTAAETRARELASAARRPAEGVPQAVASASAASLSAFSRNGEDLARALSRCAARG